MRYPHILDVRCHVEEALGTEEKPGPRAVRAAHEAQVFVQEGVRGARGDGDIAAPALSVEACCDSDRLDKRRLAASVLASEERHVWVDLERVELPDRGDRERVGVEVVDVVALQDERTNEGVVRGSRRGRPRGAI